MNRDSLADNAANLPAASVETVIEGGKLAGFGDYGPQAGDGTAAISAEEQWERTATAIDSAIESAR